MHRFDHEKLDAYRVSLDFVVLTESLIGRLPRGRSHLAEQLHRAATSVCLNIAEGAGEFSPADEIRFYRMAKRSATECAAILDVLERITASDPGQLCAGRELLVRMVSMLTKMAQRKVDSDHARA